MKITGQQSLTQSRKVAKTESLASWRLGVKSSPLFSILRFPLFAFRSPFSFILHPSSLIIFLLLGCASPRVVEVSSRTRTNDVAAADERIFMSDHASRMPYRPHALPVDEQREEFYVSWRGANVDLIKFEYRQLDKPDAVFEKKLVPVNRHWYVFDVRGEDFHTGGHVSAWRVSLWTGDQLLAERKSALW